MKTKLFLFGFLLSFQAFSQTPAPTDWKTLYQQMFVWNIWKNTDVKQVDFNHVLERAVYYSPLNPNKIYREITSAKTSDAAFQTRERLFNFGKNRRYLEAGLYLDNVSGIETVARSGAGELLHIFSRNRYKAVPKGTNYFDTEIGGAVAEALKDHLMIVIPGFGSHTIPDYTYPEIVEDANEHYLRPKLRTATTVNGETLYIGENSPEQFYRPRSAELKFDVVHPLGNELGNSMGKDEDSAENLMGWIKALPSEYASKKLILVGYSKGASIAYNVVKWFPEIRKRTALILTIAGANQGSIAAQNGIDLLTRETNSKTPQEALAKIKNGEEKGQGLFMNLLASLAGLGAQPVDTGFLTQFLASGIGKAAVVRTSAQTKQYEQAIEGVIDLTNYERIKWNLTHLNDSDFDQPITVMNLSVITNIKDFLLPDHVSDRDLTVKSPLTMPQLTGSGEVNNVLFSRDAVFLHLSSVMGFQQAPGGLFDTQVAWLDSKGLPLDERILLESLSEEQINQLHIELLATNGLGLPAGYLTMPRNVLLQKYNESLGKTMSNLNFIDLGDVRGNHWDVSFRQVYKPSSGPYYEHTFPRKAALTALIETAALFVKSHESVAEQGSPK